VATNEAQISVRLPEDLDRWVEEQAGGKREKPAFIRRLLERQRHREEEVALQRMFDQAWDSLPEEERAEVEAEREEWFSAYSGGGG
jgi:Arc/MetJ-type ribon-helix-helix transcriptional regulator